jgi:hypothetical protein
VENFSRSILEQLAQHGLHSSAAELITEGSKKRIVPSDCISFPWLIVEHKKLEQEQPTDSYLQAANAGAAALMLFRTLVEHADQKIVPPVVTMTTVGETVRLWIAYFDDERETYVSNKTSLY